jgi:hypothetical protein
MAAPASAVVDRNRRRFMVTSRLRCYGDPRREDNPEVLRLSAP